MPRSGEPARSAIGPHPERMAGEGRTPGRLGQPPLPRAALPWVTRESRAIARAEFADILRDMNLNAIIDKVADGADDFLAGASNRSEARAGIAELLNADYPQLSQEDKTRVTEGVMAILEDEDFFVGIGSGGGDEDDEEQDATDDDV